MKQPSEFEKKAQEEAPGLLREFLEFLQHNKLWWMLPIVIVLLLLGMLIALSGSGAAPFIYTLH